MRGAPVETTYSIAGTVQERRGRRVMVSGRLADAAAGHDVATVRGMFLVREDLMLD